MDNSTQQNMKPYITPLLLGALALLLIYIYEQDQHVQSLQSTTQSLTSELIIRKNHAGKLLAERQAMEVRVKDLRKQKELAEKIKNQFDIKLRNLQAYQQTNFRTTSSGSAIILSGDLSDRYYIVDQDTVADISLSDIGLQPDHEPFAIIVQDGYLDAQIDVYDSLHAPYTYTYSDTVTMAFVRRGPFWNKKLYGSTLLSNPKAKVLNSHSVWIRQADRRWGIGPCVTYGVTSSGLQTTFGISVQYSLIRF